MNEDSEASNKVMKPPMPPSKDTKASETQENQARQEEAVPQKKVLMPPMPPSKEQKPFQYVQEETGSESKEKNVVKPPKPPSKENKPTVTSTGDLSSTEIDESGTGNTSNMSRQPSSDLHPPTPPLKDVKPKNKGSVDISETAEEPDMTKFKEVQKQQGVMWDSSSSGSQKGSTNHAEVVQKCTGPPALPKKKPLHVSVKTEDQAEGLNVSVEDLDKKSIDSGQLSAEESESSDQVSPSTDKLQSSLEVLDGVTSEEDLEGSDSKSCDVTNPPSSGSVTAVSPCGAQIQNTSLKSSKLKSASAGNLLTCSIALDHHGCHEVDNLQTEVSMEIKKTGELLDKISPREPFEGELKNTDKVPDPKYLLTTAMEKLRRAEQFLREAKSLKEQDKKINRASW